MFSLKNKKLGLPLNKKSLLITTFFVWIICFGLLLSNLSSSGINSLEFKKLAEVTRIDDLRDEAKSFEVVKDNDDLFIASTDIANIELNKKYASEIISNRQKSGTVNAAWQEEQLQITPVNASPTGVQISANQVLFENVYENVDMLKTVVKQGVKEDLILKKKPVDTGLEQTRRTGYIGNGKWQFEYEIKTDLFAVIEDGAVNYYNQDNVISMYHPKPYMLDAEGTRSERAYWGILDQDDRIINLQLYADTRDLVYPIDLDPTTYITYTDESNYTQEDVKREITNWVNDGVGVYENDSNTKLLLHAEGDEGTTGHDITANGDPIITNTTKFSEAVYFDGTGDYLEVPDSTDWNFGTGDFAIDFWVYFDKIGEQVLISREDYPDASQQNGGTGGSTRFAGSISIMMQSAGYLRSVIYAGGTDIISVTNTGEILSPKQWYHVAVNRSGTTARLFVDGKNIASDTSASGDHTGDTSDLVIGKYANFEGVYFNGYMDDIRVTKGDARWTSDFTPATTPLTSDTNTKLLLHADGSEGSTTFTDSGNTVHTVTAVADAKITGMDDAFGDAMNFDGTGDYLSFADSDDWDFGSGNFTIDFWVNFEDSIINNYFYKHVEDGNTEIAIQHSDGFGWRFFSRDSSGSFVIDFSEGSNTSEINKWYHIAVARNGSQWDLYRDGISIASTSNSWTLPNISSSWGDGTVYIACEQWPGVFLNGSMDELRITKGEALWTSGFTPPTGPVTADTNTKLLLSFEGDESDLSHTVTFNGDAQMVTSGKYAGAYSFDGTGDYLEIPDSDDWNFGTGNFTIDFWAKMDSTSGNKWFIGQSTGDTYENSWFIATGGSGAGDGLQFAVWNGGTKIIDTSYAWSYSADTWYHIALVRNVNDFNLYVDGSEIASSTDTDSIPGFTNPLLVGARGYTSITHTGFLDEVRISKGLARWTSNFTPEYAGHFETASGSAVTVGNGEDTKLLIQSNTIDGSTTVEDSSIYSKDITVTGDVNHAGDVKFGQSLIYFDGTGDYLSIPDSDDWDFGSGDFTIDTWVKFDSISRQGIVAQYTNQWVNTLNRAWNLYYSGSEIRFVSVKDSDASDDVLIRFAWTPNLWDWYHLAVVNDDSNVDLYIDGVSVGSGVLTEAINSIDIPLEVGSDYDNGGVPYRFNGSIDELRISKGSARWTSSFTPPISAYTETTGENDSSTVLLINSDSENISTTFTDSSVGGSTHTITTNGDAEHEPGGKFGSTALYFDGSGDYLSLSDSDDFNIGDEFTLDFWVKHDGSPEPYYFNFYEDASNNWYIGQNSSGIGMWATDGGSTTVSLARAGLISDNDWHHIALVKTNWTAAIYKDGTQINYDGAAGIADISGTMYVGQSYAGTALLTGSMDEIRISSVNRFSAFPNSGLSNTIIVPTSMYSIDSPKVREGSRVKIDGAFYDIADIKGEGEGEAQVELSEHVLSGTVSEIYGTAITDGEASLNNSAYLPKDGLLGSWSMDGNWSDNSGNGLDGTAQGGASFDTSGQFDQAGSFDAVDDYVNVGDQSLLKITGAMSTSLWIKLEEPVPDGDVILSKFTWGYAFGGYGLFFNNGTSYSDGTLRLVFMKANGTAGTGLGNYGTNTNWDRVVSNKNNWNVSQWYHIATTWDGTTNANSFNMYIDGKLDISRAASQSTILANTQSFEIGGMNAWSALWDGLIDELSVYNRELTSEEVEKMSTKNPPLTDSYTTITSTDQVDVSTWQGIDSVSVNEESNDSDSFYSLSFDGRNEFKIWDFVESAWRTIASNLDATTSFSGDDSGKWGFVEQDEDTKLLLHAEGDVSDSNHSITTYGNPKLDNRGKIGGAMSFDGVDDYLTIPDSPDFDFGNGDFTVDTWIYYSGSHNNTYRWIFGNDASNGGNYVLSINTDNVLQFYSNACGSWIPHLTSPNITLVNQWLHVAVTRNSDVVTLYENGNSVDAMSGISACDYNTNNHNFTVWRLYDDNDNYYWSGYIDEFRVSKGTARWTSNFTPPVSAHIADTDTKLLLHFDGDRSLSEHDVTFNGGAKIDDTARFSQAAYFDGTGDYLSIPDSADWDFGSGDFTIDGWVNFSTIGSNQGLFQQRVDGDNKMFAYWNTNGTLYWRMMSGGTLTVIVDKLWPPIANNWYHLAFVKHSTDQYEIFIDGNSIGYTSDADDPENLVAPFEVGVGDATSLLNGSFDEFRISKGLARWTSNFTPPTEPYTSDANTDLLLHMDGTEGSTTFTDSGKTVHTVTANGDAKISGLADEFGDAFYFDGTDDYLSIADSDDWDFGSEDFTIDGWFNFSSVWSHLVMVSHYEDDSNRWILFYTQNGTLKFYSQIAGQQGAWYEVESSAWAPVLGNWYHISCVRDGNTMNFYVNGESKGSGSYSQEISGFSGELAIGTRKTVGVYDLYFNGYMDEIRISKGTARWTSNFTVPSVPNSLDTWTLAETEGSDTANSAVSQATQYRDNQMISADVADVADSDWEATGGFEDSQTTLDVAVSLQANDDIENGNDESTKLLIHSDADNGSIAFADDSDSGHSITANGDTQHVQNSVFGTSAMSFDGTGDYLSIPDSDDWDFGSGNFTIDMWTKLDSTTTNYVLMSQWIDADNYWMMRYSDSVWLWFYTSQGGAAIISLNQGSISGWSSDTWYHLAVVRNGNDWSIYRDGVSIATTTDSDSFPNHTGNLRIGVRGDNNFYFAGAIDELRVSKGTDRWASDFTPPTSSYDLGLGNDADTVLLLQSDKDTNSTSFVDSSFGASTGHVVTANGDAKHNVSHKFGESAMYFDGVGDYLSIADSDDWDFGTEDYTIDGWFYLTNNSVSHSLFGNYSGENKNSYLVDQSTGGKLRVYAFNSAGTRGDSVGSWYSTNTFSLDIWHHVALVQYNDSLKLYVDGRLEVNLPIFAQNIENSVPFCIGAYSGSDPSKWSGYVDELRVTKGLARWTSDFTSPSSSYGATDTPEVNQVAIEYTLDPTPTEPTSLYVHDTNAQSGTAGTGVTITSYTPHFSAVYNDSEPGDIANAYQIQVDNNSNFSSPEWDSGTGVTITNITEWNRSTDITYSGATLVHNTTYYYRIKFWDDENNEGVWSTEESSFITDLNTMPSAPDTLKTESNTNPINLSDTTPEFTAIYRDSDAGDIALKYQIQVNTVSTFTGTTLWDSGASGTALSGTGCLVDTTCEEITYAGSQLTGGVTYYWRTKFWDDDNGEGVWSTEEASFSIETGEPSSKILYPKDGDDLSKLPKIIGTASDGQTSVDFVRISIKDNSADKWYSGTGFVADTEIWLMAQGAESWSYVAPIWVDGTRYTIRSRATDTAQNEEKTAEATFTFDTTNGEEGSVYAESIRVADNTNYIVYFPVSIALNTGDKFEVIFESGSYAFTGSMVDADITVQSASGSVTGSIDIINSTGTTVISTITGSVAIGDVIEMHFINNKVRNPASTGMYDLTINTYNSGSTLLESGIADIAISGQDVVIDVQLQEALVVAVDTGSVIFNIDPDVQMGQNWAGTGGAVSQKNTLTVSTNNESGYALRIALAGYSATGSAVLDGATNTGNQLLTGDARNTENRFGWALTSTAATVSSFGTTSSTANTGISNNARVENDQNDLFYFINVNYGQESDTYRGTVVFTVIGGM